MHFPPSGISARPVRRKRRAPEWYAILNRKRKLHTKRELKKLRGVCAAGWGEPCPALRDASETSTNRGNALGRGASSPQQEMGTAHFLVFEPFPYLELALVALAEIPEADAEGVFL